MHAIASEGKLVVYYDGLCRLCSAEISHYQNEKGAGSFIFSDITAPLFDAKAEGVDPVEVHKVMHVRDASGVMHTEVDAFIVIWKALPRYNLAAKIAELRGVRPLLNVGYRLFAAIRPYLPRKKQSCEQSPYCDLNSAG